MDYMVKLRLCKEEVSAVVRRNELFLVAILYLLEASCTTPRVPRSGIVVAEPEGAKILKAPEVSLQTLEGKHLTLSKLYGDVTLVVFTTYKGGEHLETSNDMREAVRLAHAHEIPVVEFVWPLNGNTHAPCRAALHEPSQRLICLSDPGGRARKRFGVGEDDRVFLVAKNGRILASAAPNAVNQLVSGGVEMVHELRAWTREVKY